MSTTSPAAGKRRERPPGGTRSASLPGSEKVTRKMIRFSGKAAALVAALSATLLTAACSQEGSGPSPRGWNRQNDRIPAVEAVEVVLGTLPLEERLSGSVRARNQTEIYPEISGRIVEVLVSDGDHVEAGDVLVRLQDTDYRERLRQAEEIGRTPGRERDEKSRHSHAIDARE